MSAASLPGRDAGRVVVVSVGNDLRRDDGAGPAVLAELADGVQVCPQVDVTLVRLSSPVDLLGCWDGAALAIVVDAVRTGSEPGRVHVLELDDDSDGIDPAVSSHGAGIDQVLGVARALGSAPGRVVLVGIEGTDFAHGPDLSDPVRRAVGPAAGAVRGLLDMACTP